MLRCRVFRIEPDGSEQRTAGLDFIKAGEAFVMRLPMSDEIQSIDSFRPEESRYGVASYDGFFNPDTDRGSIECEMFGTLAEAQEWQERSKVKQ